MTTPRPVRGRDAFAELFARERRKALGLAYVLTGDGDLAEEVVAEAFARMYPHWSKGTIDDPRSYLRRAICNEVTTVFRKRAVRARTRLEAVPLGRPADAGLGDRDAVVRAMQTLPAAQRAAVALRFLEDLSEADTARVLGVSLGTVKSQVSRGLVRLRAALSSDDEGVSS